MNTAENTAVTASVLRRVEARPHGTDDEAGVALGREWLVTNGIGGYASASIAGLGTRKYHGLLVAALPNPLGRTVMLNHLVETVVLGDGTRVQLSGEERTGSRLSLPGVRRLKEFRLEAGLPVWTFEVDGHVIEKSVLMPHRQNTTLLLYRMIEGRSHLRLELRPALHFRHHEEELRSELQLNYRYSLGEVHEITCDNGPAALRLRAHGPDVGFQQQAEELTELHYRIEAERGYRHEGRLWSPGVLTMSLLPGDTVALVASTESIDIMNAMSPEEAVAAELERRARLLRRAPREARTGVAAELVLAADQFVITPNGRRRDTARAWAEGDEIKSVIAGYHWFTDWGRDTMISLEGLTLCTGRTQEAASILRTFGQYVHDGLLPNMFPDGSNEGLYHTADATLWFFHALDRYHVATGDDALLARLLPTMVNIAEKHIEGTRYGIGVDPEDGLLRQGAEGYQLTWMDAKCDGWVVTPRRGKAVEINALWFNALRVLAGWLHRAGRSREGELYDRRADHVRESFNQRFWFAQGGYLYDVVDGPQGNSAECRPNQVFAISLPHPVLDRSRWAEVLQIVRQRLLTPVGLRSLAPGSANYAPRYFGTLKERDAAYHQGTVWGWLIGPWLDAWRKQHPGDDAGVRAWLDGLIAHIGDFGIGSVAEVFDAEAPYTPRGCIAQAWSVAELLRQLVACRPAP
ncbi:amylo-alpha-1,6-glucosidase [Rhizobacter sp. J219]|uniref:amylo-alpha-1,6-glucosidase n=1 Tax=Rhizobacter sp. J219 TaxID=2898430 RepID=UPI002150D58A|nr:amylo-alpha-1,6-glucosidase [Rhizobacter sp. J219]MCR5882361.1 amylo-alpha-1,6-glucosidase [Rhizobacter sp. J219]